MRMHRLLGLAMTVLFAATGVLFLFFPDNVLGLFNTVSSWWGMTQSPLTGSSFYLILAVGYMYMVTLLAFLMFKHPEDRHFPFLLANAKLASSVLSLALFLFNAHYLIYLANFVVDGLIGTVVLVLYVNARSKVWA
jgi:hypothetical protein